MRATIPRPPSICCVHGGASVVVVPRAGSGDEATAVLKVQVEGAADDKTVEAPTALPIGSVRGLALHGEAIACWNATRLEAFALVRNDPSSPTTITGLAPLGALHFPSPPAAVTLVGSGDVRAPQLEGRQYKEAVSAVLEAGVVAAVFVAVDTRVEVYRLHSSTSDPKENGTSPRPSCCLAFTEREGRPTHLDVHGPLLAAATDKGCLKLFDAARHPPRQLGSAGRLLLPTDDRPIALRSLRVNADGSWVSLLAARQPRQQEEAETGGGTTLYLYDVDRDTVVPHDFGEAAAAGAVAVTGHAWDARDPRLLACELQQGLAGGGEEVATLFVATGAEEEEGGEEGRQGVLLLLDRFPLQPPLHALVGMSVPRLYLTGVAGQLLRRTMRVFVGLDYDGLNHGKFPSSAQAALRAFHSHILRGDLSAAYRAGAGLRSPLVWENMARLCVRARRLEAAELCLAKMSHARGVRAVQEARAESEQEGGRDSHDQSSSSPLVPLAAAAVQLGMPDEAARLYREARRPDLLLRLLVARGRWEEALALADGGQDPLRRRRTHFEYAVHLEAEGRVEEAARHYAVAGAQHRETPRMLLQAHHLQLSGDVGTTNADQALARYIAEAGSGSDDLGTASPALLRWWAAHCEAQGRFGEAKAAYRRAGAWADLVRLACYEGDIAGAEALVAEQHQQQQQRGGGKERATSSALAAACFRLAQHLEGQEHDVLRAIEYYAKAGCYNHCVRLARAHELDGEAMAYALKGPASLMRDCARHFARKRQPARALQLFTKARDWEAALALCLRAVAKEEQRQKAGSSRKGSSSGSGGRGASQSQQLAALVDAGREIAQGLSQQASAEAATSASPLPPMSTELETGVGRLAALLERWGHAREAIGLHLFRLSSPPAPPAAVAVTTAHRVLQLCQRHEVPLTEATIDRLLMATTTSSTAGAMAGAGDDDEEGERIALLSEAAHVCAAQGSHASASRLYTQAGDRRRGLECLFALGDVDGVIRYASTARRPELFVLAAEHLRASGAWRRDERVRAAIGEFYVRGKAEEGVVRAFEEEVGRSGMLMKHV